MLREFHALALQSIKMRRGRISAVKSHVRPAEVISDDEDDVGLCLVSPGGCQTSDKESGQEQNVFH